MLCLKDVVKIYGTTEENKVEALKGISINFRKSEFVSILGPSGCGKTTLLNIVGGLDRYTSGDLIISGKSTKDFKDKDWDAYRNESIGFIFQTYNLIAHQTVLGNVELALTLSGVSKAERRQRALEVLEKVGLKDKVNARPNQLSGGQMQRVAIARALVNNPQVILADEPTGALDSETSVQVMEILKEVAKDRLVIMVTHNPALAEDYSTRIIKFLDGRLTEDSMPYSDEEMLADKTAEEALNKEQEAQQAKQSESETEEPQKKEKKNKTRMSFLTALNLSFRNLLTKKARTIITSFAGSIGIIGVCLVLAISNGFNQYINAMQSGTLGGYPVSIGMYSADMTAMETLSSEGEKLEEFPSIGGENNKLNIYDPTKNISALAHLNLIDEDYIKYLTDFYEEDKAKDSDDRLTSSIKFSYTAVKHVVTSDGTNYSMIKDDSSLTDTAEMMSILMGSSSAIFQEGLDNDEFVKSQYDCIAGSWATKDNELMLVVDSYNRLSMATLAVLGINYYNEELEPLETMDFNDLIENNTFRLMLNDSYYVPVDADGNPVANENQADYFKPVTADAKTSNQFKTIYDSLSKDDGSADEDKCIELKIKGVIRIKEDAPLEIYNTGLIYREGLTKTYLNNCKTSKIVEFQKQALENENEAEIALYGDYKSLLETYKTQYPKYWETLSSMITSDYKVPKMVVKMIYSTIFGEISAEQMDSFLNEFALQGIGGSDLPSIINIYPKGFEEKKEILSYLDAWNKNPANANHKILYTDASSMLTSTLGEIVNIVQIVLIAFSAVSLVVSSIMIGIITYVSVIERTKEIGVLRSVGARKKDISRVFNAETLIVGFVAGLLGVVITYFLCLAIVNPIINAVAAGAVHNIASLSPLHALIMVGVSMVLTLIGGSIPAGIASKKDPVEALRTE